MRTALDVRCHFGAPWLLDHPPAMRGVAPYHLVTRGAAQVEGIDGLQGEAEAPGDGSDAIVRQLASALFALSIRAWLAQTPAVPGLFALLAERRAQPAVHAMLDAPQQPWTLATLAELCHMSRATFARVFGHAAGAAPLAVLTQLRMAQAARLLETGQHAAGMVAEMVGYQSEAAFHRAFKRRYGVGPGAWRRQAPR